MELQSRFFFLDLGFDTTAVEIDDIFHQIEPQTGAAHIGLGYSPEPVKFFEDSA